MGCLSYKKTDLKNWSTSLPKFQPIKIHSPSQSAPTILVLKTWVVCDPEKNQDQNMAQTSKIIKIEKKNVKRPCFLRFF